MSSVLLPASGPHSWLDRLAFARTTWRTTRRRQWAWVLVVALVVSLIGVPQEVEQLQKAAWPLGPTLVAWVCPTLGAVIMFLAWRLADAGDDARRARVLRMALAVIGGAAVTTVCWLGLWLASGSSVLFASMVAEGKAPPSVALIFAAEFINLIVVSGMVYAVAEAVRRRSATQRAFEHVARQQAKLQHALLQARLAAMQAQVEPHFLFDTLVGIEALYQRDPQRAADQLDQLIAYLRAALPRLRESGSSMLAELELVEAYLAIVRSLHGGAPTLTISLADDCRDARFYPMLLLPLVQRAVRDVAGAPPASVRIAVQRAGEQMVVVLRVAAGAGCAEDGEIARVRERLAGLYGARAALECQELAGDATQLTMRLPLAGAVERT